MARWRRLLPISLRQRTWIVTAIVLLAVIAVALSIVWNATGMFGRRQATIVHWQDRAAGQLPVAGVGANIVRLPEGNLVTNGSFSPNVSHAHYFASDGASQAFHFKMGETRVPVPLENNHYRGASFAMYRETQTNMELMAEGKITEYETGIVSYKRMVQVPEAVSREVRWRGIAEFRHDVYVCGEEGAFIRLHRDGTVETIKFGFLTDLNTLAAGPDGMLAGDRSGRIYVSEDGVSWSLLTTTASNQAVRAIEYIALPDEANGFFLASGGPGEIYFGHMTGLERLTMPFNDHVTGFVGADDGVVYAFGDRGNVARSTNGISWELDHALCASEGWHAGDAAGGMVCLVGKDGQMALRHGQEAPVFVRREAFADVWDDRYDDATFDDVVLMSSSKIVVIASSGRSFYSSDQGATWRRDAPLYVRSIDHVRLLGSGDLFIAASNGDLMRADLTARLTFHPPLEEGRVSPGDLMILERHETSAFDTRAVTLPVREAPAVAGTWYISGGAAFRHGADIYEGTAGHDSGGAARLTYVTPTADEHVVSDRHRLFSVSTGTSLPRAETMFARPYLSARISQKLDLSRLVEQDSVPFYQLELDLRPEGEITGPIEVWLTGTLPDVEATVSAENGVWQHRRETMILPRGLRPDDEVWLNIGFAGSGTLHIDNVWFGRSEDSPGAPSSMLTQSAMPFEADLLRLDAIPIGRVGYRSESWCLPEGVGHNLGAALQWTERMHAVPWLVIDVNATQTELMHLVEYLAGSPLSTYGKLRSRDGAIGRWTDAFDAIYIEVMDRGGVYPNDAARANYVRWVMRQLEQAPDFNDVRHRVFFIDGMPYDDGRTHTSADFHGSDLVLTDRFMTENELARSIDRWVSDIPRRGVTGQGFMPEAVRSVSRMPSDDAADEALRMVDVTAALLGDLGHHATMAMADIDLMQSDVWGQTHVGVQALNAARHTAGKLRLDTPVIVRDGTDGEADDEREQTMAFYGFTSRQGTVVYALNLSETAHIVSIQGFSTARDAAFELYDWRGFKIRSGTCRPNRDDFTLLPGGVLTIYQETISEP